jgi:hypothetical protein
MCDCACHLNKYNPCNIDGGCGTNHRHNTNGDCVTCPALRPDKDPRQPNQPPVCDGDRTHLDRILVEIGNLYADLVNDEPPIIDTRQHERFGTAYLTNGRRHTFSRGMFPSDPLAALGGVAPINSRSRQPNVSGSRERPLPINTAAVDLKAPARSGNLTPAAVPDDQIGHLSAATILNAWARDIRDLIHPDQHLPAPTVPELVMWIRHRLPTVCDQHPNIADLAEALRNLRGTLRATTGQTETRPEPCTGIPCKQCDLATLARHPGGTIECGNPNCQAVLYEEEYTDWLKTLTAQQHHKRHAPA